MPCGTILTGASAMFTNTGYVIIPIYVEEGRKVSSRCCFNSWKHYYLLAECYNLTAQPGLYVHTLGQNQPA